MDNPAVPENQINQPTILEVSTPVPESPPQTPTSIQKAEEKPLQKETKFKPNDKQKLWLATSLELRTKVISVIARESKIDRGTFYDWVHDVPGFMEWYNHEFDVWIEEIKVELIKSGVKQAESNHSWWRDMMVLFGIMKPEQFEQQESKPINQVNVMAAAFQKSAEERGVVINANTAGPVPTASQNGPA